MVAVVLIDAQRRVVTLNVCCERWTPLKAERGINEGAAMAALVGAVAHSQRVNAAAHHKEPKTHHKEAKAQPQKGTPHSITESYH